MENKEIKINVPDGFEIDKENSSFELIKFKPKQDKNKEMSDFLFSVLKETTCKITGEKRIEFYNKNNEWLIQQDYKNGRLWMNYYRIWSIFESRFGLNYEQIKEFIGCWVEANLGWKSLTPILPNILYNSLVEANLGWKSLTPQAIH
jgi:hypothetical protein